MELIQEPFDENKIQELANTVRFQKKNYLKKVDNINEHVHGFSVALKDEDLEYEWRLQEINSRKALSIITCIGIVMQDVGWAFFASHVSIVGKAIKAVIDIGLIFSMFQTYFNPRVKKNKAVIEILNLGNHNDYTKWEIIQLKLTQQRECQRQFLWYQVWWFFFIVHMMANDIQHNFETRMTELTPEKARLQNNLNHFMVGINLVGVAMCVLVADIHWIYMGISFAVFTLSSSYQVYRVLPDIFTDFVFVQLILQVCVNIFNYKRLKSLKSAFLQSKKIQSLLKEQIQIFQHLPDGAVIHRELINGKKDFADPDSKVIPDEKISIDIRHLNNTFKEMFRSYREKLRLEKATKAKKEKSKLANKYSSSQSKSEPKIEPQDLENNSNSMQQDEESNLTNLDENAQDDEESFLKNIYLQKSPYKIIRKMVQQIEDQPFLPIQFKDAIKDFESGQVYSVLTKDEYGNFNVLSQQVEFSFAERVQKQLENKDIKPEFTENGFLIYIVTQEVLFNEEISTITYFKDITFGVLYEQVKAQRSLETAISRALQQKMGVPLQTIIQNCQSIECSQLVEKIIEFSGNGFVQLIKATRVLTNLMVCQLRDMQDWNELKGGKFRKVSQKFDLFECLKDIFEMTMVKAKLKDIKMEFNLNEQLPSDVLGDRARFQQIALNLMTNALNHTDEGKIRTSVSYDRSKQQIYFEVEDTGIGIKQEEQENMFKIFKDSGNIGMGLTISREIANKYNGNIKFTSKYKEGSTFAFTFELEEYEKPTTGNFSVEIMSPSNPNRLDQFNSDSQPVSFTSPNPSYEVKPSSPRFEREVIIEINDKREVKPASKILNAEYSLMDSLMNMNQEPVKEMEPVNFVSHHQPAAEPVNFESQEPPAEPVNLESQDPMDTEPMSMRNQLPELPHRIQEQAPSLQKLTQEDTVVEDFEEIYVKI